VRPSRLITLVVVLAGATACGQAQATHTNTNANTIAPPASTRSSTPKPAVELAASAARTSQAKSARMAMTMRMTVPPNGESVVAHANGVVGFRNRDGDLTMSMTIPGAGVIRMREVMVWPVIYMHSPLFAAGLHGKQWMKIDMAKIERSHGVNLNALTSTGSSDPTQMLQTLENESDSLQNLGAATVRGVPTVHYHAVIDLDKAARNAPAALRAAVRKSDARLVAMLGSHRMPMDVWISQDHLVRRLAYHMALPIGSTGDTMTMAVRLDMFDFGVPVHVTAPPPGQVAELPAAAMAATR
jgi:hypothetical protein